MTDTSTTGTENPAGKGIIEHIEPHALILDTNVRDEADIDAEFLASIKEHGVQTPIIAIRDADGQVRVRSGQRRTLAARVAGLTTVPVCIRPTTGSDKTGQLVERVTEQIVENDQRRQLTDAQRARGIQQMLDAGLWVTKVAKKLSVAKDTVKAAGSAAKSTAAMDALANGQLSLIEAAAITEFEDMPGALNRLLEVAGTRQFEHTVAQLREERASADLNDRITTARQESWLGDVEQLQLTLEHLHDKQDQVQRLRDHAATPPWIAPAPMLSVPSTP